MPVSTRSQIAEDESNRVETSGRRATSDQEQTHLNLHLRNPHHGLKEKMKALTLLYEQQKKASAALRNPSPKPENKRFTTHPSVELLGSRQKEEKFEQEVENHSSLTRKIPNSSAFALSRSDKEGSKENHVAGSDPFLGSSCAKKETSTNKVARKLSMGCPQQGMEEKGVEFGRKVQEMGKLGPVLTKSGSRILVFVRLRPMGKKEKEAGSRSCVKIVNGRDVYLSEFANENDYLRLKRLRGRHFTFDAAFPDFTTQQQVYSTS